MPETFRSTGSQIVLGSFHSLTNFNSSSLFAIICNATTFAGIFLSTLGRAVYSNYWFINDDHYLSQKNREQ